MGNGSIIRVGDVQRMSAGLGVTHSEFNPSDKQEVHLLQIWIHPEVTRLAPGYEQKHFAAADKRGRLRLIARTPVRTARWSSTRMHACTPVCSTAPSALTSRCGRPACVAAGGARRDCRGRHPPAGRGWRAHRRACAT